MNKKKLFKFLSAVLVILLAVAAALTLYTFSPLHPKNISDKTVAERGAEYTVKLTGVSEYDENGFAVTADGFYFTAKKAFVYTDGEGFACTSYEGKGEDYILGRYNSPRLDYENYSFCGETYRSQAELEAFFEEPDRIYNFDIDKLPEYIQGVIGYEKKFTGRMTVKIHRGRFVVTELYIGDERVLELKK